MPYTGIHQMCWTRHTDVRHNRMSRDTLEKTRHTARDTLFQHFSKQMRHSSTNAAHPRRPLQGAPGRQAADAWFLNYLFTWSIGDTICLPVCNTLRTALSFLPESFCK